MQSFQKINSYTILYPSLRKLKEKYSKFDAMSKFGHTFYCKKLDKEMFEYYFEVITIVKGDPLYQDNLDDIYLLFNSTLYTPLGKPEYQDRIRYEEAYTGMSCGSIIRINDDPITYIRVGVSNFIKEKL